MRASGREPFQPEPPRGANTIFDRERFRNDVKSTVFRNAPAGFIYPGDPGFPAGTSGLNKKWWNLAPRVGIAWDVRGRPPGGSLVVRAHV